MKKVLPPHPHSKNLKKGNWLNVKLLCVLVLIQ